MKRTRGAVLVFGIFFMLIIFAVMGYFYEMGRLTLAKIRAQNAADASAMGAQTVLSNLRNTATTHYMVADIFRRIAVTTTHRNFPLSMPWLFSYLTFYSWYKKDLFVNNLPDDTVSTLVKLYHFMFHIQDFAVTRMLAAYDSKIFFRDFIKEEAENEFSRTRNIMRYVSFVLGYLNLYMDNQLEGNELGFVRLRFDKEGPDWAPEGLKVDYGEEVNGPHPHRRIRNKNDEIEINKKLARAYSEAYVLVPPSNFLMRTFFSRNWGKIGAIREPFSFIEGMYLPVRTDAAAGPKEFYIRIGLPTSIPIIGNLSEDGYWSFPQLIPTIKVEGQNPIEGQWPYH
ncbi:MAG: Tad domain-containing protein [Candidatus Hydrothermales bacterium]